MRYTIRALGWIITILWILVLVLPVTAAFSLMKIVEARNIGIQEPKGSMSNGNFLLSIPFYIDNAGFYDLTDVGISLRIRRENETIFTPSAEIPIVPAGRMVTSSCNVSLGLTEIISKHKELLTADTRFNVSVSLRLRVASAIALNISTSTTMSWGAPFHELTIYNVTYDPVNRIFSALISFNNHAFFQINETFIVKLYDFEGKLVDSAVLEVNVPSYGSFQGSFIMRVDDPSKLKHGAFIRVYYLTAQILEVEWLP